jgi:cytosine/adenosine deaminase-related metal-dependent hydrolase
MILRARHVLPVAGPPIPNGAILLQGSRIAAVGSWPDLAASAPAAVPVIDYGDALLLPGLVNAHCHLDYTDMAGLLAPTREFPDWIKTIMSAKGAWSDADFHRSWLRGASQLLTSGTTSAANIESLPAAFSLLRPQSPVRIHSFLEITGVRLQRDPAQVLADAEATLQSAPQTPGAIGLSPHAPYSTIPQLLRLAAQAARRRGWRLTTHLAESRAEFDMFMYRRGSMFEWLESQRDCSDCGQGSPIRHAARHDLLGPDFLAVHVNYLWEGDARLLADSWSSVVHCPRSHSYFRHQHFPATELAAAGVNLCLGTDSLASTRASGPFHPTLSLFDEMAELASRDNTLPPSEILARATLNGARALGQGDLLGALQPGRLADLAVIPGRASDSNIEDLAIHHSGPVLATWIGGRCAWHQPGLAPAQQAVA